MWWSPWLPSSCCQVRTLCDLKSILKGAGPTTALGATLSAGFPESRRLRRRSGVSAHEVAERLEVTAHAMAGQLAITCINGGSDALVGAEHLGLDLTAGLRSQPLN